MKKIIALLCFTALLSCESDKLETVTIPGKYTVELPGFLSKATGLHDEAALQYQNVFKEFYIIILDEPKQQFNEMMLLSETSPGLESYASILKDGLAEVIKDEKFDDIKDTQVNGMKSKTFSVAGEIEGIDAFYKIAYVEGKENYYQIVTWTLVDKKEKYAPQMDQIIGSFRELGTSRGGDRSKK